MKYFIFALSFFLLTTCSKRTINNNCNYLFNLAVNYQVNMNLPQFSQLQYTGTSIYIAGPGNGGIIITNVGNAWRAWDASDPNHTPSSCSTLTIDGANAVCGCADGYTYSLFIGQPTTALPCGLKEYRVDVTGNNSLLISN
ncbi:MAG: hypothetical protein KDC68_01860 [Gelidibacter sp.]|nr:hypothetical protein [Gelidibacter sp.]